MFDTHTSDRLEKVKESQSGDIKEREKVIEDVGAERQQKLFKATQLIWWIFGVLEALIGFRVILKLIAANPINGFARFIYHIPAIFLHPFFSLIRNPAEDGSVLEVTSLIAMLVYALVGWLLVQLIGIIFYHPARRSVSVYEREDKEH